MPRKLSKKRRSAARSEAPVPVEAQTPAGSQDEAVSESARSDDFLRSDEENHPTAVTERSGSPTDDSQTATGDEHELLAEEDTATSVDQRDNPAKKP